ncbi:hypothetical protein Bbelb_211030 [Branchiostoma belcheri]|nr:hypothetical protein Bbelb_211030 [Branchiostoma belcheri]
METTTVPGQSPGHVIAQSSSPSTPSEAVDCCVMSSSLEEAPLSTLLARRDERLVPGSAFPAFAEAETGTRQSQVGSEGRNDRQERSVSTEAQHKMTRTQESCSLLAGEKKPSRDFSAKLDLA